MVGCTPLPYFLLAQFEKPFASSTLKSVSRADALIVLGGYTKASSSENLGFRFTYSADRLIAGVEALKRKKVNVLVLSGGPGIIEGQKTSEGRWLKDMLDSWIAPSGEIVALTASYNTLDEAAKLRTLAAERNWTNIILVTSGYHMPRALRTFRKQGVPVQPLACDFVGLPVVNGESSGFRIVPSIDPFRTLGLLIHEVLGWGWYSLNGWL